MKEVKDYNNLENIGWAQMQEILDQEMPTNRSKRIYFWLLAAVGLCLLLFFTIGKPSFRSTPILNSTISHNLKHAPTITKPIVKSDSNVSDKVKEYISHKESIQSQKETKNSTSKTNSITSNNKNTSIANSSESNASFQFISPVSSSENHKNNPRRTISINGSPISSTKSKNNNFAPLKHTTSSSSLVQYEKKNNISNTTNNGINPTASSINIQRPSHHRISPIPQLLSANNLILTTAFENLISSKIMSSLPIKRRKWHASIASHGNYNGKKTIGYEFSIGLSYQYNPISSLSLDAVYHRNNYPIAILSKGSAESTVLGRPEDKIINFEYQNKSIEMLLSYNLKLHKSWEISSGIGIAQTSYSSFDVNKEELSNIESKNTNADELSIEEYNAISRKIRTSTTYNNYIGIGKIECRYLVSKYIDFNLGYIHYFKPFLKDINIPFTSVSSKSINASRIRIGLRFRY